MMNPKSTIKVLHAEGIIQMNSTFAKMAENTLSDEYRHLQTIRADYPDYPVIIRQIQKNAKQEHYKGLSYDYMRYYISKVERTNALAVLNELEHMIDIGKCHSLSKRYPVVKSWFLSRYPEVAKHGLSEEEIAEAAAKAELRKIEAAEKTAKAEAKAEQKKRQAKLVLKLSSDKPEAEEEAAEVEEDTAEVEENVA